MHVPKPGGRARLWPLLLALFLLVLGARLWLVQNYTTPLPFWDQWDGEGGALLKPWLEGRLRFESLFVPHNEHRIFLTRALALGLFALNGQWDAQLEMTVNALLCGGIAVAMAAALARLFPPTQRWTIAVAVALLFALPFAWENTLAGFQSQFYLLFLFSLAALWGLGIHAPFSRGWWIGVVGAGLACLTMGSGFLAAAAVLGFLALRLVKERVRPTAGDFVTALLCLALVGIGWGTRVTVPWHAPLQAESAPAFVLALGRCLAWPFVTEPLLAVALQGPFVLLVCRYLLRRSGSATEEQLLLVVGLWVWLQAAATAYARGGGEHPPASRYQDLLALGALVNFLSGCIMLPQSSGARRKAGAIVGLTAWMGLLGLGFERLSVENFRVDLPTRRRALLAEETNVRGYLATGDFALFLADKPLFEIPYPDATRLAGYLDDPTLRSVLPANVRRPLPVEPAERTEGAGFARDGSYPSSDQPAFLPSWGSYTGSGNAAQGAWRGRVAAPVSLPYLRFGFAGYLGDPGLSFALQDGAKTTGGSREFHPARPAREHWRVDYLRAPGRAVEIVAADRSATRWFAFSEPTEVGRWSYWSGYLLRRGGLIFTVGALLGCLLVVQAALRWLKERSR